MTGIPKWIRFGCGHRAKTPLHATRTACPICRDRRVSEDDRRRLAMEREIRRRERKRVAWIASVLNAARLHDEDVPLRAWAGTR